MCATALELRALDRIPATGHTNTRCGSTIRNQGTQYKSELKGSGRDYRSYCHEHERWRRKDDGRHASRRNLLPICPWLEKGQEGLSD